MQCSGKTKKGIQCTKKASTGKYCYLHTNQDLCTQLEALSLQDSDTNEIKNILTKISNMIDDEDMKTSDYIENIINNVKEKKPNMLNLLRLNIVEFFNFIADSDLNDIKRTIVENCLNDMKIWK